MKTIVEIGLPDLQSDDLDMLAEGCEQEVSEFILENIPSKSIAELSVSCSLEVDSELDLDFQITLIQQYDTGHSIDEVINEAMDHGALWLEKRLLEMKKD
ncbi:MAG: DUF3194 domain-containing protein [Candidatus Thorarchaeota archaeon]